MATHFMKHGPNLFLVSILVLVVMLISLASTYGVTTPTRFPLYHREKFMSSHFKDHRSLVLARLARDKARLHQVHRRLNYSNLAQFKPPLDGEDRNETEVFEEGGEYVTVLKVGSPPQKVQLLVDMGTPLTWWMCKPNCQSCYETPHHIFDTSVSSTYSEINCTDDKLCDSSQIYVQGCIRRDDPKCHYSVRYEDGSITQGIMAREVVATVERLPLSNSFSFGCGRHNYGTMFNADATGILGFVPGGYSLPTQLQIDTFTFCLPTYNTTVSGTLFMNYYPPSFQYTSKALLDIRMDHYYLGFSGIEINEEAIPIPPEFWDCDREGVGGVILDTGTTITKFPTQAYDIFKDYFVRNVEEGVPKAPGEDQLDTCFNVRGVYEWDTRFPRVKFLFKVHKRPLELDISQILMSIGNDKYCLAFGAGGPTTIIGSWQLQGSLIGFNLPMHVVAFQFFSLGC